MHSSNVGPSDLLDCLISPQVYRNNVGPQDLLGCLISPQVHRNNVGPQDLLDCLISPQVYRKTAAFLPSSKLLPTAQSSEFDPNMSQPMALGGQEESDKEDEEQRAVTRIPPQNITNSISSADWPLLLKDYLELLVRNGHYTPIPHGSEPFKRDIKSYISSGIINLDKPSNPSSHEVVAWLKRILR